MRMSVLVVEPPSRGARVYEMVIQRTFPLFYLVIVLFGILTLYRVWEDITPLYATTISLLACIQLGIVSALHYAEQRRRKEREEISEAEMDLSFLRNSLWVYWREGYALARFTPVTRLHTEMKNAKKLYSSRLSAEKWQCFMQGIIEGATEKNIPLDFIDEEDINAAENFQPARARLAFHGQRFDPEFARGLQPRGGARASGDVL